MTETFTAQTTKVYGEDLPQHTTEVESTEPVVPAEVAAYFEAAHDLDEKMDEITSASPEETTVATLKTRHGRIVLVTVLSHHLHVTKAGAAPMATVELEGHVRTVPVRKLRAVKSEPTPEAVEAITVSQDWDVDKAKQILAEMHAKEEPSVGPSPAVDPTYDLDENGKIDSDFDF